MWKPFAAAATLAVDAAACAHSYAQTPAPEFWPTLSTLALVSLLGGGALAAACADAWFNRLPTQRTPLTEPRSTTSYS